MKPYRCCPHISGGGTAEHTLSILRTSLSLNTCSGSRPARQQTEFCPMNWTQPWSSPNGNRGFLWQTQAVPQVVLPGNRPGLPHLAGTPRGQGPPAVPVAPGSFLCALRLLSGSCLGAAPALLSGLWDSRKSLKEQRNPCLLPHLCSACFWLMVWCA